LSNPGDTSELEPPKLEGLEANMGAARVLSKAAPTGPTRVLGKAAPIGPTRLLAVGDIHGEYTKWVALMQRLSLLDARAKWVGGNARVVLVGDYVDRGRQGLSVLRAIRRLEAEASGAGGKLVALMGNHDAIMIANARGRDDSFPVDVRYDPEQPYDEVMGNHYANGGYPEEVAALTRDPELLEWYASRPLLHLEDEVLFLHGNLDYSGFGATLGEVNALFHNLLRTAYGGMQAFALLTVRHWAVDGSPDEVRESQYLYSPLEGVRLQLNHFGGKTLVHGHTPENVTTQHPLLYAAGTAFNIDHALCYHPDLRGYALELTPGGPVRYHIAEERPLEHLSKLRERHRLERVSLKKVMLRDQMLVAERDLSLTPTPLTLEDVMHLDRALDELDLMTRHAAVNEDRDALESLIEQLHALRDEWGVNTTLKPGDMV